MSNDVARAAALRDPVEDFDYVFLDKLRLAATVILGLSEGDVINGLLETELGNFRDRVDRALLRPAAGLLASAEAPASRLSPVIEEDSAPVA